MGLLWRLLSLIFHSSAKFNVFAFNLAAKSKLDPKDLVTVAQNHTYGEWLFFGYLASNMNGRLFKDLLTNMADQIRNSDQNYKGREKSKGISRSSSKSSSREWSDDDRRPSKDSKALIDISPPSYK